MMKSGWLGNDLKIARHLMLIALMAVLGLSGCEPVRERNIAGVWELQSGSRVRLPSEFQNANATFIFDPDGTFTASQIPGLLYTPGKSPPRLESGKGK